ncbi:MAG: hypothetical protein M3Q75_09525 [Gemmatimonadota bacterium]|nr:hypothetical protein [Gemmatimonadota bacterium]
MTLPENYDLTIYAGATLKRWFALRYPDGSLANLVTAGYTVGRLTVRDIYGGTAQLTLTTANGGVSVTQETDANGVTWSGSIYASPATTAALTDFGDGVFDLEIDNGSDVIRVFQGVATLSREATI